MPTASPSSDSFEEKIRKAQAGDRASQDQLCSDWAPFVQRYLASRMRSAAILANSVSDLTQEVWLSVFLKLGSFTDLECGERGFKSWLVKIASARLADLYRAGTSKKRDSGKEVAFEADADSSSLAAPQFVAGSSTDPLRQAMDAERKAQTRIAIDRLPEPDRSYLRWYHIEGLSYDQIASMLGKSKDAVRIARWRATELLLKQRRRLDPPTT